MGDIADDIISGFMCSWCGTCFEEEHGYPVLCEDCLDDYIAEGHTVKELLDEFGIQPALNKEL